MQVMVLYEPGRAGDAAVQQAGELAQDGSCTLTLVGIVPQAEGGPPRCGGSAREYNIAVMEQVASELHCARSRLGPLADEVRVELLIEGADPPLASWSAAHRFDTILLPARRRLLRRSVRHPEAPRLLRETSAEIRIVDARGDAAAARS